jgi:hypothetical protein
MIKPNYSELIKMKASPGELNPDHERSCPCNKEGLHPPHIRKNINKQKPSNIQPQHPHVFLHIKIDHLQSKWRNQNQDISLQAIT